MALIVERQTNLKTVGELIAALQTFPDDMPIEVGMEKSAEIYRAKPEKGEVYDDPRGEVCLCGYDRDDE